MKQVKITNEQITSKKKNCLKFFSVAQRLSNYLIIFLIRFVFSSSLVLVFFLLLCVIGTFVSFIHSLF